MNNKLNKKILSTVGASILGAVAFSNVANAQSPFAATDLGTGYMVADAKSKDVKAGEAKCGADAKMKDGKCGEGKCGAKGDAKMKDGKCGAKDATGKDAAKDAKMKDGKCGEGKCGKK